MSEQIHELALDKVIPNPGQPRKEFSSGPLEELARSIIATDGVMEPIVVKPYSNPDSPATFIIIAGERRWRASGIAGMPTIKAVVKDVDDRTMAMMALAENLVRQDLSIIEEGTFLKALVEDGIAWDEISAICGMARANLEWKIEIVDRCTPQIIWLVRQGTMTGSMAWRVGKLTSNGQMRFLHEVNQRPMTQHEQMGLIEAIWATENAVVMPGFEETQLSEEQVTAARSFAEMLDRCIKVCEKLESVEEKRQGTLATALATEMDVSLAKTEQLITRLAAIKRAMQKRRGQMALNGAKQ